MSRRLTKEELDEQFELFLKESVSDDSLDLGSLEKSTGAKGKEQKAAQKPSVSWWEDDHDEGLVGSSGKSFLKSLRKTQTIREEEDEESSDQNRKNVPKDNVPETHGASLTPALGSVLGLDTLEEEKEKEKFSKTEEALHGADKEDKRESPGSPHYSDDFEEEGDEKEPEQQQKPKISPILAKVSLYDRWTTPEKTREEKRTSASQDKAQSYVQSGASDLEALHKALQIQATAVHDSEELNPTFTSSQNQNRAQSPLASLSPPQLRAASTAESDLPTAEELMKPIRPEENHLQGFSLQPISVSDQTQASDLKDLLQTLDDSLQIRPGAFVQEKQPLSGWTTVTDPLSSRTSTESTSAPASAPALTNKTKKQQVSHSSGSSLSHLKRPAAAQVKGRALDSRTAVTSRPSSVAGPTVVLTKSKSTKPTVSQPRRVTKEPDKSSTQTEAGVDSIDLVASVQSLVSVLQQQINTKYKEPATDENQTTQLPPNRQAAEISASDNLKALLLEKEKLIEKLKQDSEELDSLKQQNYLLQSKLRSAEESLQKNRLTDATDSKNQEKLQQIDREMKEQETLIQGYQQENERLYQQMKTQQARSKANEEVMFKENQRLLSELASTREQLNKAQRPVSNLCSLDHGQRITQLLAQISAFQRSEERQKEEIQSLKQHKLNLEVDLQLLKDQREETRETETKEIENRGTEIRNESNPETRLRRI
ncbi:hypothetical protein WMY93_026257 [Mugilogobius chulae]|uniref:Centrosomal protein of 162 kDa n=1 Tax=Mugilogobius chulae TaxID=88201 RepID=A0AAW0MX20_9GOBI